MLSPARVAITPTDLVFKYSVSAAAGNTTASTADTSLGDQVSVTQWVDGGPLFHDISGADNAASTTFYRCVFIHNLNASNALENAVVWISSQVAGGADVTIGVDPTAASAPGAATAQALSVADENTAPAGVTFSAPTTQATGLALGTIPANSVKAIWLKAQAANVAALSNDGVTISVAGDTGSL